MIPRPNPYTQFMDSSHKTTPAIHPVESSHHLTTMAGLATSCRDDLEQLALSMSSGGHSDTKDHVISCHAHVASSDSLCIRVNTPETYKEVNRLVRGLTNGPVCTCVLLDDALCINSMSHWQLLSTATTNQRAWHGKPHLYIIHLLSLASFCELYSKTSLAAVYFTTQVTFDSMIGQNVSMKDKVTIKHTMVNSHSVIGEKSRLLLSVIMDHVKIGDKWVSPWIQCNRGIFQSYYQTWPTIIIIVN